mmetsp:Transcript_3916/g.5400  ORF Transcript_3916/g.5400 Transcript_3916/m.5400 type:complete len:170 (+) Transcript_3916:72-581(+)|eukprot:CAMPEP_0170073430 /NCGR_PEP_ID=MMETSP0019_2-20121128/10859_1 /TAXON_ID=98059 /ORGANISM="Dinobryon sp., Strain UTEXLB2267" /LENGTH=169 /DNA_ID=CAMNT_0010282975 /DNA_START=85 /DNA_END=594 /DNA_ORIENTATION=-
MSGFQTHLKNLRDALLAVPLIKKYQPLIEDKTKVLIEYYVIGLGGVIVLCLFTGFLADLISNLIGFVYPVYATIRALESKSTDDDKDWLIYWVVFSAFFVAENFVEVVLYWIPFFYPLKVTFLLWCMSPQYKGAEKVYNLVLKRLVLKGNSVLDEALKTADAKKVAAEN